MTENVTFKVGDRIAIDDQENVPVVELRCPLCAAEGKPEAVPTPATRVQIPALFKRFIPKWAQEKAMSLEEAILKAPALAALIEEVRGRKEARRICVDHGKKLRAARIWTDQLFVVMQRQAKAADRRAEENFGSIASLLGGEKVGEIKAAVGKAEVRRTASRAKKDAEGEGKGSRNTKKPYSRSQSKAQGRAETAAA